MKKNYLNKLFVVLMLAVSVGYNSEAFSDESAFSIQGITAREARKSTNASMTAKAKANASNLAKVCKNVSNLSGLLLKITAGGHIPRSDPRYSGYSIICAGRCVSFPAVVYHCDGSQAFRMGYYGRWSGNGKSRGYCGHGASPCPTSSVRAKSKSLKCNGAGYLDTGTNSCMRFNLYSDRNGGV